jgi:hypothetical protein
MTADGRALRSDHVTGSAGTAIDHVGAGHAQGKVVITV